MPINGHSDAEETLNDRGNAIIRVANYLAEREVAECGYFTALLDELLVLAEDAASMLREDEISGLPREVGNAVTIWQRRAHSSGCLDADVMQDYDARRQDYIDDMKNDRPSGALNMAAIIYNEVKSEMKSASETQEGYVYELLSDESDWYDMESGGSGVGGRRNVACVSASNEDSLARLIQQELDDAGGDVEAMSSTTSANGDLVGCVVLEEMADE